MSLKERVHQCERRRPGITRAEVARRVGIAPPSVTAWFTGDTKTLKLKPACRAAKIWGCDPLWLGEGEGLPQWTDEPAPAPLVTLADAVDALGLALSEVPRDQRLSAAELLATFARAPDSARARDELLQLLRPSPPKVYGSATADPGVARLVAAAANSGVPLEVREVDDGPTFNTPKPAPKRKRGAASPRRT